MKCSKCKKNVYRAFSYEDGDGKWHSGECEDCYPMSKVGSWSKIDKIKSRVRMPDGTVLQGRSGQRIIDARRKAQSKSGY